MFPKLKISSKMFLICLVFTIPIWTLLYLLIQQENLSIDFTNRERIGITCLRPLRVLLVDLQNYKTLSYLSDPGKISSLGELSAQRTRVDGDFAAMEPLDKLPETRPLLNGVRSRWEAAKDLSVSAGREANDEVLDKLIKDFRELFWQVGDNAGLILDPQLETYYTVDNLINKAMNSIYFMPQLNDFLLGIKSKNIGRLTPGEKTKLIGLVEYSKFALYRTKKNSQAAIEHDVSGRLKDAWGGRLGDLERTTEKVTAALDGVLDHPNAKPLRPSLYFGLLREAQEANLRFWDSNLTSLDKLLVKRIDGLELRKRIALLSVLVVTVLTYLLAVLILRSIQTPIRQISDRVKEFARGEGDFTLRLAFGGKDEIGELAGSFNIFVEKLHEDSKLQVKSNDEFYRAIIERTLEGVAILDEQGKTLYVSPAVEKILGYKVEERMGESTFSVVHPDDLPRVKATFKKLLLSPGSVEKTHFRIRRKDGMIRDIESIARSHFFKRPDFLGIILNYRDVTEEKKAKATQEMLQGERDQLLQSLQIQMDQMPIALVMTDEHFGFTYWNPAAEKMFGYSLAEVEGKKPKDVYLLKSDWDAVEKIHARLKAGEKRIYGTVNHNIRKDGQVLTCEWYNNPLLDEAGHFVGRVGMAIDITERQKAGATKERLASILEQTEDGVITIDLEGRITDWNQGAEKIYGYTRADVLGKTAPYLKPNEHKALAEKTLKAAAEGHGSNRVEVERSRKDGQRITVETTTSVIRDEKGQVSGYSAIVRDVTARKKAEEDKSQLVAILEQTPDAVVGSDLEGKVTSWNRGAEKIFGYSPEEVLGKSLNLIVPEPLWAELDRLRAAAIHGEPVSNFETVRVRKDGGLIHAAITLFPVKDVSGKLKGVSAITRDISERKKAEESAKRHEEQMRLAQKMDAIGRLAGGVAHDFNNILSIIGGNTEFMLPGPGEENPHGEELLEIKKAVQRGAELAKQLLVFSQKQVTEAQPVNLNEISVEFNKLLKRLLGAQIELSFLQDKDLKPILADGGQMQQTMMNLAINARDAMPQGGSLIIETKNIQANEIDPEKNPTIPPGNYSRLTVTDTGMGMTPEIQKRIFEPFFTTKGDKGTGLGLATVYGIVNQWKGHIQVHSSPGLGTSFSLYFPVLEKVPVRLANIQQAAPPSGGTETVLVAEDEESVRRVLVRTLEKYGYRVLEGKDGVEALALSKKHKEPIHLLVTDTIMPKMNGKELATESKKIHPEMKVLFVSGYPQEVLSQQGVLDPGIHLLLKPYEGDDILRKIRVILDEG